MLTKTLTAQDLEQQAETYRLAGAKFLKAAEGLDAAARTIKESPLPADLAESDKPGARTSEGRARISEANRTLWKPCPRPECRGKRHRSRGRGMHAHFKRPATVHTMPGRRVA